MHILFLTDNFPPEGNAIASRVYERACYWVQWGHEVTIVTSVPNFPDGKVYTGYKNKFYQVEMMQGIRVVRVKTFIAKNKGFLLRTLDFLSYILPAFTAGLFQKKIDVIAATTPQFFVGITAYLLKICKRKPFILEVADMWPASIVSVGAMKKNLIIKLLEKIELFLYARANSIICLTDSFKKNMLERGVPAKKISVIINGVEIKKYQPKLRNTSLGLQHGINSNHFVIGYIGTHGMAHNLKNVLNAAKILQTDKNIIFMFIGSGAEKDELVNYAHINQLDNVKFIPLQPKHLISEFWNLCDVALVHLKNDPVFAEVIPSKIFEAMAMKLPILLAAPKGEASKIIVNNNSGIWVPAADPAALAAAVRFYYQNPDKRKTLAENSFAATKLFSRERQAKDVISVLQYGTLIKEKEKEKEMEFDYDK